MSKNLKKNKVRTAIAIGIGLSLLMGSRLMSLETNTGDDVDSLELRSIIVEGWEKESWRAVVEPGEPLGKVESKIMEGVPKNLIQDTGNKKSFGIRYQFVYPGINNKVVLLPPESRKVTRTMPLLDDKTNTIKTYDVPGIRLPGKVKAVSVWVLGRGNEYELEGWIEDWKGDTHIYNFGSLDFIGWRPLTVTIPDNVPQDVDSFPQTKNLVFKKFVVRSTPTTSSEKVVLYFDTLKVLTDMYDVYFDGADLNFDDTDKAEKEAMKNYEEQLKKDAKGNGSSQAQ